MIRMESIKEETGGLFSGPVLDVFWQIWESPLRDEFHGPLWIAICSNFDRPLERELRYDMKSTYYAANE